MNPYLFISKLVFFIYKKKEKYKPSIKMIKTELRTIPVFVLNHLGSIYKVSGCLWVREGVCLAPHSWVLSILGHYPVAKWRPRVTYFGSWPLVYFRWHPRVWATLVVPESKTIRSQYTSPMGSICPPFSPVCTLLLCSSSARIDHKLVGWARLKLRITRYHVILLVID